MLWLSGLCMQELRAYMNIYGDSLVPRNFWENPELGEWCYNMRIKYRELSLSQRQIRALEEVKFPWKSEMVTAPLCPISRHALVVSPWSRPFWRAYVCVPDFKCELHG